MGSAFGAIPQVHHPHDQRGDGAHPGWQEPTKLSLLQRALAAIDVPIAEGSLGGQTIAVLNAFFSTGWMVWHPDQVLTAVASVTPEEAKARIGYAADRLEPFLHQLDAEMRVRKPSIQETQAGIYMTGPCAIGAPFYVQQQYERGTSK